RILTLGLGFVFDGPGDCNLNMMREFVKNLMPTRGRTKHDIEDEEADYRPAYDPRGIHVTKIKEPESDLGHIYMPK
ncbi:hypothetical protein HAX54_037617, partial [Datura stramonium]|nr:hypothetical protein [Datura stramonium]